MREKASESLTDLHSDLENLRMWEPLQGLLSSSSDDVKVQALWVIGTAVQNNPSAQRAVRLVCTHSESFVFLTHACVVPRTGPLPDTPSLPLTRLTRTRSAQIEGDIRALGPAKTPRCRSRVIRSRRWLARSPRRLIR